MAPLPCSPQSRSEESNSHSQDASEEDSDDSLTTPRPGPADPSQRTSENLSTPAVIPGAVDSAAGKLSSSPGTARNISFAEGSTRDTPTSRTAFNTQIFGQQGEGYPRNPYTYSSSPRQGTDAVSESPARPPSQKSVSFSSGTSLPKPERQGSYSLMSGQRKSAVSPARMAVTDEMDGAGESSSADENTAIMRKSRGPASNYGAAAGAQDEGTSGEEDVANGGYDGDPDDPVGTVRRKRSNVARGRKTRAQEQDPNETEEKEEHDGWWKVFVEKYGSVELENKGSVARDHLALERTFLAWLRTSLSFASIGIAVTQLFRLNTSLQGIKDPQSSDQDFTSSAIPDGSTALMTAQLSTRDVTLDDTHRLRHVGKPLGATFLAISILILLLGFHRYFESQHYVIRGKFPASRGTILVVTFVATALIIASLVVVLVVAPSAFEK